MRFTLDVEFAEAVQGAKKRVSLPDGGTLDLSVPEGVSDGQVLRFRGRGEPGMGEGEAGDALVEVRVRPHRDFERQGNDILLEVPITIDEAVLGARVEVPTVSGRVHLTIPKGTSSGQVLRLKGKGVRSGPSWHGGRSAREGAHRAARHHRRQPVLLLHRMAPEAPLRSRPQIAEGLRKSLSLRRSKSAAGRGDKLASEIVRGRAAGKEWREPRPWTASAQAPPASAAAHPRRKAACASPWETARQDRLIGDALELARVGYEARGGLVTGRRCLEQDLEQFRGGGRLGR